MIVNPNEMQQRVADLVHAQLDRLPYEGFDKWTTRHPENIDSGRSGAILFLLECYRFNGDARLLRSIDGLTKDVIAFCRANPTRDYSLYEGRGGVILALIDYYLLSSDKDLLRVAIELVTPASGSFLHDRYTSNGLYGGRAGALLVIFRLYLLTGAAQLLGHIDQFIDTMILHLDLSGDGLYFDDRLDRPIRPDCSFAFGTAGIAYALEKINLAADNPAIVAVVEGLNAYTASCWTGSFGNWGNYSSRITDAETLAAFLSVYQEGDPASPGPANRYGWADGTAGILLSPTPVTEESRRDLDIRALTGISTGNPDNLCLYDGLAGVALCSRYLHERYADGVTNTLADEVHWQLSLKAEEKGWSSSLMRGTAGIWYYLLCSMRSEERSPGHILDPFADLPDRHEAGKIEVSIDSAKINRVLTARYYPRSVSFLERVCPDLLNNYYASSGLHDLGCEVNRFAGSIRIQMGPAASPLPYVEDILELERSSFAFFQSVNRSPFQLFLDGLLHKDSILERFRADKEGLLDCRLSISPHIAIIETRWDWTDPPNAGSPPDGLNGLKWRPATTVSILLPAARIDELEYPVKKEVKLLLDQFSTPRVMREAIENIKRYIGSIPPGSLKNIVEALSELADTRDFLEKIDDILLAELRQWVYQGILVLQD